MVNNINVKHDFSHSTNQTIIFHKQLSENSWQEEGMIKTPYFVLALWTQLLISNFRAREATSGYKSIDLDLM